MIPPPLPAESLEAYGDALLTFVYIRLNPFSKIIKK